MNKKLLLLCISKIFCVFEIEKSYFGIMDVGQGNCNIMIYDLVDHDRENEAGNDVLKAKVGYMYDCGSSEYPAKYTDIEKVLQEIRKKAGREYDSDTKKGFTKQSYAKWKVDEYSNDQQDPVLCQQIHEKLKELDYLTVFLSHPDTDHFNILHHILYPNDPNNALSSKYYKTEEWLKTNENIEFKKDKDGKDTIKIAVFAFGDWSKDTIIEKSFKKSLRKSRSGSALVPSVSPVKAESASAQGDESDVKNLFGSSHGRKIKTSPCKQTDKEKASTPPKTSKLSSGSESTNDYDSSSESEVHMINLGDIPVAEPYFWKDASGKNPQFFSGNLTELFKEAKEKNVKKHFARGCDSGYLDLFDEVNSVLSGYVNILSANTKYTDKKCQNTVSPFVSFTHKISPDQYMSVLCTGDADNNTIAQMLMNNELQAELCGKFVGDVENIVKEYKPKQRALKKEGKNNEAGKKGKEMIGKIGTISHPFENSLESKFSRNSSILHEIVSENFDSVMAKLYGDGALEEIDLNNDNHHIAIVAQHHSGCSSLCSAISLFKPALIFSSNGYGERVKQPNQYTINKVKRVNSVGIKARLAKLNNVLDEKFNDSENQLTSYKKGEEPYLQPCSYWISTNDLKHIEREFLKDSIEREFTWDSTLSSIPRDASEVREASDDQAEESSDESSSEARSSVDSSSEPAQEQLVSIMAKLRSEEMSSSDKIANLKLNDAQRRRIEEEKAKVS